MSSTAITLKYFPMTARLFCELLTWLDTNVFKISWAVSWIYQSVVICCNWLQTSTSTQALDPNITLWVEEGDIFLQIKTQKIIKLFNLKRIQSKHQKPNRPNHLNKYFWMSLYFIWFATVSHTLSKKFKIKW